MGYLVHDIGHVQLNVTDPEAVVADLTGILGLAVTQRSADEVWLTAGARKVEVVLHRAEANALRLIGFEAPGEAEVAEVAARLAGCGCRLVSERPSLAGVRAGVVFVSPQGHLFEVHTPVPQDIDARRHPSRGMGPKRLDHVNITAPDPGALCDTLERLTGMRLSERMADDSLVWMRGGNRQHHILGLVKGETGLHHYSFEVGDFADYKRLGDLLDRADKQFVWGPGRHRPGDNTYAYFLDASGAMVECSGDMSVIADDAAFTPNVIRKLERPANVRVMNVWGTPAPLEWREHRFPHAPVPQG